MDSVNAKQPTELTDAELASIHGGFLDWLEEKVFKPIMAVFRGGNPPPNVPINPQDPFSNFPRNPGSPQQH